VRWRFDDQAARQPGYAAAPSSTPQPATPTGPPTFSSSRTASWLGIASWLAHYQVRMTGGSSGRRLQATISGLRDDGYGFSVYLEP
jgi:hypothetical protein